MAKRPQVRVREYSSPRQMERDVQKHVRSGWLVADTQMITTESSNRGCGCLLGMFGFGRGKSVYANRYIVRYEKRP